MTHWEWMLEQWSIERERSAAYIAARRARRRRAPQPASLPGWAANGVPTITDADVVDGDEIAEAMEALPAL